MTDRDPGASALLTDLYQLTMLKGYWECGMHEPAAFEFFVRRLPGCRNFLLAAGLEPLLGWLEGLRFEPDELEWLAGQPGFPADFVDWLGGLRFTGDVDAMPEGTPFFADEPLVRIVAPLPEAQLVETRAIALLHFSSLVASKAARFALVAPERLLVDFGLRRAHGAEAGLLLARSAYLAGFAGTASVLAGRRYGLPTYGTMAHSFVQAHDSETDAFLRFARAHPDNTVLLIDTYDTEAGAAKVVEIAPRLRDEGIEVQAVRIDSGDLADHAHRVRDILDRGGLGEVRIFASGGLDETDLRDLAAAPIDGFGIGTALAVSADAPALDCAYKLQEYAGVARRKRSEGKATWPGRRQVYRVYREGRMAHDVLGLVDESVEGEPLLEPAMRGGRRTGPAPTLDAIRARARSGIERLPAPLRSLDPAPAPYGVEISSGLRALAAEVDRRRG